MLEDASNQQLLAAWKDGNQQAARVLVRRYMARLTALARSRLSRKLARRIDAEDIVMSAWRSFFAGANLGRLAISDDDNPWPLLVTITLRKLARQAERHTAERRNAGQDVALEESIDWQMAVSRDPSPEEAAMLVDQIESLMGWLDEFDREVLTRRLQGDEQATIALAMNCSERTIRRSIQRIRATLADLDVDASPSKIEQEVGRENPGPGTPVTTPRLDLQPSYSYREITLQKLIGEGGFGKVYRSVCHSDGSTVAVKFLRKPFWKNRRARDQLLRETHLVSSLTHPNIVQHRGWGATPFGALFVVMDWIDGQTAGAWFQSSRGPIQEILHCGIAMADALSAAHVAGLVHGDLTPNNVLRRTDGSFLLTDFGFARMVGDRTAEMPGGTPGFLAPEQLSDLFGPIGIHTDVYGLGGLIYSMLTGFAPTTGRDVAEILANVLSFRSPPRASDRSDGIPQPLDELLARCLRKEPGERPQSITEVATALLEINSRM